MLIFLCWCCWCCFSLFCCSDRAIRLLLEELKGDQVSKGALLRGLSTLAHSGVSLRACFRWLFLLFTSILFILFSFFPLDCPILCLFSSICCCNGELSFFRLFCVCYCVLVVSLSLSLFHSTFLLYFSSGSFSLALSIFLSISPFCLFYLFMFVCFFSLSLYSLSLSVVCLLFPSSPILLPPPKDSGIGVVVLSRCY